MLTATYIIGGLITIVGLIGGIRILAYLASGREAIDVRFDNYCR